MKDFREHYKDRECREFYGITDSYYVEQVQGFACSEDPENRLWWVPELGYSMSEGFHLFTDRKKALKRAISEASEEIAALQKAVVTNRKRLKNI